LEGVKNILYYNRNFDYNIITMKTKIFISKANEGWSEVEIPAKFQQIPYEKLVLLAHTFLKKRNYKGLLITQNPSPFPVR
jgi:hypothetical protein